MIAPRSKKRAWAAMEGDETGPSPPMANWFRRWMAMGRNRNPITTKIEAKAGAECPPPISCARRATRARLDDDSRLSHARPSPRQSGSIGLEPPKGHEELDPATYGFTEADYDRKIFIDHVRNGG